MKLQSVFVLMIVSLFAILGNSCKKSSTNDKDKLPPITQTGANTFGCLINGEVYVPKGYSGTGTPNPHINYDYNFNGQPYFSIEVNQLTNRLNTGSVIISFLNLNSIGYYSIGNENFRYSIYWDEFLQNCFMSIIDSSTTALGGGYISKLDIPNRIISGTFDFKAIKPGCDTVRITDGRFDFKF